MSDPFEKRFNIPLDLQDTQKRFMNRIWNGLRQYFHLLVKQDPYSEYLPLLRYVADQLGMSYEKRYGFVDYAGEDFYQLLHSLEALYAGLVHHNREQAKRLKQIIESTISLSETDLGIQWKKGTFRPSGAKLLDEKLVNEPMRWLADLKYKNVREPFEKGLIHYMEAKKDSSKLSDTVTDMYESLEALARTVLGNNNNLLKNAELFVSQLKLSKHWEKILSEHISYINKYRHAPSIDKVRTPPEPNEVEACIYTTGLFIRLATQQLTTK